MRARRGLWLLVAGLLIAGPGGAQEPDPQKLQKAADAFDEGTRSFRAGRYDEAAESFELADRLAPNPGVLAKAIEARRLAKQPARASTLAAAGLARYPDDAAMKKLAQGVIKASEKQLHQSRITCKPACALTIDGKVAGGDTVTTLTVFLEPGPHTVIAGWSEKRSKSSKFEAQKGGDEAISLEAPPLPPPPPPSASATAPATTAAPAPTASAPPPPATGLSPWFFFAGLGATVVLGGVSTWSGLDTLSSPGPDKVRDACAGKTRDCPLFQEGLSKERRTNTLLITTGVVGVATGVLAVFTNWKAPPLGKSEGETAMRPWITPGGQGVTLGLDGVFLEGAAYPHCRLEVVAAKAQDR